MATGQGSGVVLGYLRYILGMDSIAFQEGLGEAEKKLKLAQKNIQKTAKGFTDIGKTLSVAVTAPLVGFGAAVIKMGGDFEAGMNRVAISTQGTADELKAMNDLALKLGKDTVFGATDAADAMDELAKNGLDARQILDGAATAAVNLASAAGSELSPAATAISDVMQQFKLTAGELPDAVNQITGAVNASKLDFADYAQAIAQAGGVAGAVGVNFQDFNTAIAATSALFASGSDAGTSFKTFLTSLPGNSSSAIAAIQKYGLSFYDAQGNMRSMGEIAEELRTKLGNLNDQAKTDVLKTIFGSDAMRTAIGLMDQGAAGLEKVRAGIAATDAAAQSSKRLQGFNGQMEQLKGAFETLAIKIAQSGVLEAITSMVTKLGDFIDYLSETNPEILKWGAVLGTLAAGIGPVALGIGSLISGFGKMLPLLLKVAPAFQTIIPVIATVGRALIGLAIAGGPLTLIAAAVAAVVVVWKNWDTIGPIVQKMYNAVKTWVLDKLGAVWTAVKSKIDAVKGWFFDLYDAVVGHSYIPDMVDEIGQNMARLQQLMVDPAQKTTQKAGDAFRDMASRVGSIIDELFPKTAELREEMAKLIALQNDTTLSADVRQAAVDKQISRVLNAQDAARGEVSSPLGDIEPIAGALDDAYASVAQAGQDAADRMMSANEVAGQSFVDMANQSLNALSNLASAIKGGGILDILSSVFNAFGAIAGSGVLGKGLATSFKNFNPISGFRANGGPVSAGRTYVVGERGPEMFTPSRSGYVHPNGANDNGGRMHVEVVPSPYFDVHVRNQAAGVAAPMAMASGMQARSAATADVAQRSRRRIPGR